MPIRTMETRFPRIGYISVGHQTVSKKGNVHPTTSDTITVHATSRAILEPIAAKYGGTVEESPTSTEAQERFFVVTKATEIPVMVPADLDVAFSQWFESWASSGLVRRCDGVDCVLWRRDPKEDEKVGELSHALRPCICDEEGAEERMCKPTVRLSVVPIEVAPDIPAIGVFTVRSTGFFTNAEIKGDLEMIKTVVGRLGVGVPMRLHVEQTKTRRGNKPKFRLSLIGTPREILAELSRPQRPMLAEPKPILVDPADDDPVGGFVDKPGGEDAGQDDDAVDAAGEPSRSDDAAPGLAPEVANVGGYDVPRAGGTKRGRDVPAITPAQLTVMQRSAKELGWGEHDLLGAFKHFAGFEIQDSSRDTAQAFSDLLHGLEKERALA